MDSGARRWEIALRTRLGHLNPQENFPGAWYASGGAGAARLPVGNRANSRPGFVGVGPNWPAGLRWGWAELAGRAPLRLGRDGGVPVLQVGRAAGDGGVPVLYWLWPAGDGGVPVLYWLWPGKDPEFAAIRASSKGGR